MLSASTERNTALAQRKRRMQRTAIAVVTSLMGVAMFYLCQAAGFISFEVFATAAVAVFALMGLFVPVFYTGFNLRFRDPTLFLPQTISAIAVTSYVMAYAGPARPALVVLYFAALVLSALRFNARSFIVLALFSLAAHASAIHFARLTDGAAYDAGAEWLQWAFILMTLPWLGWIASYLERLRLRFKAGDALYRAIWNTSIDAIVLLDQRGVISLANPAAARLFGYAMGNMRGMRITDLTPPRLRAGLQRAFDDFVRDGTIAPQLTRFDGVALTAGGREIAVDAALEPLSNVDDHEAVFGTGGHRLVLFARDVSQRHALETIKDNFIATVSHELRTPLSAVTGAVEALQHQEGVHLPPDAQRLLTMASEGGERLQRLIDTILNLQKMDTGGIDFTPQPVRAASLIGGALNAAREGATLQGKYLASQHLPEHVVVNADARWIHEVLMNLIDNALKFSPPAATVVCGASVLDRQRVRFSVIDQGAGVPVEFADQMFQRFARADSSNTRVHGGAGLGLSVCKAVVEGCGGTIGYQNNAAKGATFWFELPLLEGASEV